MIKNRQETIEDIIKEARGVFDELRKHGYNVVSLDRMADIIDRIEAAHKREREIINYYKKDGDAFLPVINPPKMKGAATK